MAYWWPWAEGEDEYKKDGFIVDDIDEEEKDDKEEGEKDSDQEKQKKKKRKRRWAISFLHFLYL